VIVNCDTVFIQYVWRCHESQKCRSNGWLIGSVRVEKLVRGDAESTMIAFYTGSSDSTLVQQAHYRHCHQLLNFEHIGCFRVGSDSASSLSPHLICSEA